MIIHLRENSFKKIFLTESTNSRRADRRTQEVIAQRLGVPVNDAVVQMQQRFRKYYFGYEGVNDDWFIVLEPNFYVIAAESGAFSNNTVGFNIRKMIQYIHTKCKTIEAENGRQAMLNYVSELKNTLVDGESFSNFVDNEYARKNGTTNNEPTYNKGNYTVIGPVTFEVAQYFGMYTDSHDTGDVICYTRSLNTWNDYTCDGSKAMYIMLNENWDMVESIYFHYNDKNAYDDYGLSMIFVIVDENGDLDTCNVRWNHDAVFARDKDTDYALDEADISELLGKPFSEVFKPLQEVGYMPVEKVEQLTGEVIK